MTVLQALAGYYDRMAARKEVEPAGFSREKISFAIVIDRDGAPLAVTDMRDFSGKKPVAMSRDVPASFKRPGIGVSPFFLWDKTSYALGVTITPDARTPLQHQSFRALHAELIGDSEDEGLAALARFLERWTPDRFAEPPFTADMLDANVVFRLDGDTGEGGRPRYIHERPAALPLIEARGGEGESVFCLVSGVEAPIARLHPSIKGVDGAQTMGAALVSFNLDAFSSYGKEQGANAPTGQGAAARYGAALNRLLDRGSRNRIALIDPSLTGGDQPIEVRHRQRFSLGDATVVFWADASGLKDELLAAAEVLVAMGLAEPLYDGKDVTLDQDQVHARILRQQLETLSKGHAAEIGDDEVPSSVRIHVLGLAPNAARLSVRFWLTQDLGDFARNAMKHAQDCRIEPLPWGTPPSINRLLVKTTAAQEKWDNIPPQLAGEVARAILSGEPYPRTWLATAIMRLRAGDNPGSGWHAAAARAVLVRNQRLKRGMHDRSGSGETPMGLSRDHENIGYQLGRLFAMYELTQRAALGTKLNRTIRDSYFGTALSAPVTVFPTIIALGQNHLGKIRRNTPGWAVLIERELEQITGQLKPTRPSTIPKTLKLEDQAEFAIGYYHQRATKLGKAEDQTLGFDDEIATPDEDAQ